MILQCFCKAMIYYFFSFVCHNFQAFSSHLLVSKISQRVCACVWGFTTHWTTLRHGLTGHASLHSPKASEDRPLSSHSSTYTNTEYTATIHTLDWIGVSWRDSWWARNTDWSISKGWGMTSPRSQSSPLAERSHGISISHFPQPGVCIYL